MRKNRGWTSACLYIKDALAESRTPIRSAPLLLVIGEQVPDHPHGGRFRFCPSGIGHFFNFLLELGGRRIGHYGERVQCCRIWLLHSGLRICYPHVETTNRASAVLHNGWPLDSRSGQRARPLAWLAGTDLATAEARCCEANLVFFFFGFAGASGDCWDPMDYCRPVEDRTKVAPCLVTTFWRRPGIFRALSFVLRFTVPVIVLVPAPWNEPMDVPGAVKNGGFG